MSFPKALALSLAIVLTPAVNAAEFNHVETARSSIHFSYKQMGVNMAGRFKKFAANLKFDPSRATAASVVLEVDLGSIDTGSAEGNSEAAGKLWFNTKAFPTALFTSSSIKPLGGDKYEAIGKLTIKGRAQEVVAPTTVTIKGNTAEFDGAFTIKRADFAIGEGVWADFSTVANDVPVKFHIVATSGK